MAILFDAVTDRVTLATPIDFTSTYKLSFWFNLQNARGNVLQIISTTASSDNNFDTVGIVFNSVPLCFYTECQGGAGQPYGYSSNDVVATIGTWFYVELIRASTTSLQLYVNDTLAGSLTTNVSARGTLPVGTTTQIGGWDTINNYVNGIIANVQIHTTTARNTTHRNVFRPRLFTGLNGWLPLYNVDTLNDYSGNGKNGSASGSLTTASNPPIVY